MLDAAATGRRDRSGGIMTAARLAAIGFIFVCTAVAWSVLGGTVVGRTGETDGAPFAGGGAALGRAPRAGGAAGVRASAARRRRGGPGGGRPGRHRRPQQVKRTVVDEVPAALRPRAACRSTSASSTGARACSGTTPTRVAFAGGLPLRQPGPGRARRRSCRFAFPSKEATYDGFVVRLDGRRGAAGDRPDERLTRRARRSRPRARARTSRTARAASASGPTRSSRKASRRCGTSSSR